MRSVASLHWRGCGVQSSTVVLVDSSGAAKNRYSNAPSGNSRSTTETIANPYRFVGGYSDPDTGLQKLGIRYYDSSLGRFTQTDPTQQETNPFAYRAGAPTSSSDTGGAATTQDSFEACYVVCASPGLSSDDEDNRGVTLSLAIGTPSLSLDPLL